jgi:hypothetical protein
VALQGEPGVGKSVVAAQLASEWAAPCSFLRLGSAADIVFADPRDVLVDLGLQLLGLLGPDVLTRRVPGS